MSAPAPALRSSVTAERSNPRTPAVTHCAAKIVPVNIFDSVKIFPYLFSVEEETEDACDIENWRPCENELILEILLPTGGNNVSMIFHLFFISVKCIISKNAMNALSLR